MTCKGAQATHVNTLLQFHSASRSHEPGWAICGNTGGFLLSASVLFKSIQERNSRSVTCW